MVHKRLAFTLILLLSLGFVYFFYGEVLLAPNDYMFTTTGDGIKNYYTLAYHVQHDSSLIHFEGMNYPYGEHFMYTDCHPVLTLVLRRIKSIIPDIGNYTIGIVNFFMLFQFVLTALFVWLILRLLKVNPYVAIIGALGILMLSPQVFRMTGHLSLSYGFFIPLTLYLTLKFYKFPERSYWLWLQMVNILFWFFIHAYLGMMAVGFVLSFWIIHFLLHVKTYKTKIRAYFPLIFWVVIPIVFVTGFISLTDTHTGRTTRPSGFFHNNAKPEDLIVAHMQPVRPLWDQITKVYQNWEGWSYIGLTTLIILIFVVLKTIWNSFRTKKYTFDDRLFSDHHFKIAMYASLVLVIFSFGLPFKLYPPSIEWFPIIQQFRTTGRFTWFFFFTSTMMSIAILDRLHKIFHHKILALVFRVLALGALVFYLYEGYPYHKINSNILSQNPNYFTRDHRDSTLFKLSKSIDPDQFQAILPLPFFYNGSENFKIPTDGISLRNSLLFSYYTGLPIVGAQLVRTSIQESKNIIQVISPDYYEKAIRKDLPSNHPFLVLKSPRFLDPFQEAIQQKTTFLSHSPNNALYRLTLDSLFHNPANFEIARFLKIRDSLFLVNGFYSIDSSSFLYFKDFIKYSADTCISCPGAFSEAKNGSYTLATFPGGTFHTETTYSASIWIYNGIQDAVNHWFRFIAEETDSTSELVNETWVLPEESRVIWGNWSLTELSFSLQNPANMLNFKLVGKREDVSNFIVDDLLIREEGIDVYRIDHVDKGGIKELFKNNHRIILNAKRDS